MFEVFRFDTFVIAFIAGVDPFVVHEPWPVEPVAGRLQPWEPITACLISGCSAHPRPSPDALFSLDVLLIEGLQGPEGEGGGGRHHAGLVNTVSCGFKR